MKLHRHPVGIPYECTRRANGAPLYRAQPRARLAIPVGMAPSGRVRARGRNDQQCVAIQQSALHANMYNNNRHDRHISMIICITIIGMIISIICIMITASS